jgi:hypothetical protein
MIDTSFGGLRMFPKIRMLRGVEGSPAGHPRYGRDSRLSTIGCQGKKGEIRFTWFFMLLSHLLPVNTADFSEIDYL